MTFGARLSGHRIRLGLTQERLAERARLGVRTIRDLERGRVARPRPSSIALLADALGLGGRERGEFVAAGRGERDALAVAPDRLPAAPREFVGRQDSLRACAALVRSRPLVITGPGGVGKTALAVRLAGATAADCPDGRVYIDLRGATEPLSVAAALRSLLSDLGCASLSVDEGELAARWRGLTAGRGLFVLLDNASSAAQVRPLLPSRGCAVVVTSRRPLGWGAEHRLGPLAPADGAALLRALSGLAAGDDRSVARVVAACGGSPLAIRIAAARLGEGPQWTNFAVRLENGGSGIALGYGALTAPSAWLLRSLTVVELDPAPGWLAAHLAGLSEVESRMRLDELADARLVERSGFVEGTCLYRVHDVVRAYAGHRRVAVDPLADVRAAVSRAADAVAEPAPRPGRREAARALVRPAMRLGLPDAVWRLAAVSAGSGGVAAEG